MNMICWLKWWNMFIQWQIHHTASFCYHKPGTCIKWKNRCIREFFRLASLSFQRPKGFFDILFIQLVSRVTKTNQDSPRSKMGRSFRIWSPFCHPSKTELKCAFFSFFRKKQNFLKKGAFKAKITARDMMWLCYKFYHCEVWNVSFH